MAEGEAELLKKQMKDARQKVKRLECEAIAERGHVLLPEELTQLQGIGQKYAAKIVEYRDQNGPFASPEDLMKVPGIGPKVLEKNKNMIVVE